ncbi:hypothetical protein AEQU1_00317 [Aequorivita sp. CIP111184]|nr:hypothetical protein AEQU1_00317 [Aequorivita sp. CIP111184]
MGDQHLKMSENQEREIYFTLKNHENRVIGVAGCNTFSRTYTLEERNRIHFSQMATARIACPNLNVNESEYLKDFELASNHSITEDVFSLNIAHSSPLAVFEAIYFN